MPEAAPLTDAPAGAPSPPAAERAAVQEVVRDFGRSLRLHLLYEGSNAALDRFVEAVRERMAGLWSTLPHLTLDVRENEIVWAGEAVYRGETRGDDFAFLFYRDGVRELTFLPGFEERDLLPFLDILARVQRVREDEDDLLTLLWDHDWGHFRYRYVEALPEGVVLPEAGSAPARPVPPPREEEPAVVSTVSREDFQETLYFLDEGELRRLGAETRREAERDLWEGVLTALYDRLEDGGPARQEQIVRILADLLPVLLAAGRLDKAADLLREVVGLATRRGLFGPGGLRAVRAIFEQLCRAEAVEELIRATEEAATPEAERALTTLLSYFPPDTLPFLLRAGEVSRAEGVRAAVLAAADRLAGDDGARAVPLVAHPEAEVAGGAAKLVGRRGLGQAAAEVAALLERPEAGLRLVAVEVLTALHNAVAAGAIQRALGDPDREVRVAAARALAALRYVPARAVLEAEVGSRRLREADLTERIAFFEAYGSVAGEAGIAPLDRTLNGKGWLGRREDPEVRACAALALGRIPLPAARTALTAAAADPDPVVRSAVGRALRGGGG